MQDTTPEAACFVAAAQIGELTSTTVEKGRTGGKTWAVVTSASPERWNAADLLWGRRTYWGIEGQFHQRLDATLDEDRSRVRTPRAMLVLGMFRRLAVSFAARWMQCPERQRRKKTTRDFQTHLAADDARRGFALATAKHPTAWISQ